MRIPQSQNLHSQSFRSSLLEFVWIFQTKQFIFQVRKDGSIYIEAGVIDKSGVYMEGEHWLELFPNGPKRLNDVEMWNDPTYNFKDYNFFSNGQDLKLLSKECLEYLT